MTGDIYDAMHQERDRLGDQVFHVELDYDAVLVVAYALQEAACMVPANKAVPVLLATSDMLVCMLEHEGYVLAAKRLKENRPPDLPTGGVVQ